MSTPRSVSPPIAPEPAHAAEFAAALQYYLALQPRQLPSRYLYDDLGSALFEAICHLPWYGVTRAESRLLDAHGAEIIARVDGLSRVAELGSGSGDKLRRLLDARETIAPIDVHLVDVSASALDASTRALESADGVTVIRHRARYEAGLDEALARRAGERRTLVLFLGSNIGNFDPPGAAALLRGIRSSLDDGDALLLGADVVKPVRDLLLAYDDPLGVTAAFNRNLLVRINRELDANFDLDAFAHRAVWNAPASRIEMHLVSRRRQTVSIPPAMLDLTLDEGEAIWTESSYKYTPRTVRDLLATADFAVAAQWIDAPEPFVLTLAVAA
ncbi:MAG TPA: L-histidine N(alpha)-methyltransferase [Vicinamibacterales bacterium]|nr:L-histidine N(alpha)-methyltransferase [Vicinamibacterales bacterium]